MIRTLVLFLLWVVCLLSHAGEPLDPAIAFQASAQAIDGQTIEVRFAIARDYYLYRDKFRFTIEPQTVTPRTPLFPEGVKKNDANFGQVEVYDSDVLIRLPVERRSSGTLPLTLHVSSQGCAEKIGICYPPQQQTISVQLPDLGPDHIQPVSDSTLQTSNESGQITRLLTNASTVWVIASFFGFGLLLSLTPCVLPMIPILSGIIVGSKQNGEVVPFSRALALSLAYVFGMATAYAIAGVAAGFSGTLVSSALQNAWILGGFALIFVILALSMFGVFELQLPSFIQSGISQKTSHIRGGSLPGVWLMGVLSALLVGPCVAPPLAGALLYIGKTGDAFLGAGALFFMALGMGVPLLAVGLSAGVLLPKAGPWMTAVNKAFGVILLACAIWIVSPLIPVAIQMTAWALLLIVPAIFLRAIDPLPPQAQELQRLGKAIGVIMLLLGAAMLIGALSGAKDPLQPLSALRAGVNEHASALVFERVHSLSELDEKVAAAGKPVLLDFYADWCVTCKEMERFTFSDARVREKLSGWRLLQVDVTANTPQDKELLSRFELFGPPGIVLFDASGKELTGVRIIGFQKADEFLNSLEATRM